MSTTPTSLKSAQLSAIERMLFLNKEAPANPSSQWKILIYDGPCRSIISPLLSVSELRSRGVTLHLLLNSPREPIPDVTAVYFCEPTRTNLRMIAQDLASGLYQRSYLNFVTKLPRHMMEEFAKVVVQSGPESLSRIVSVYDLYLDYVCLERGLFSLNKKESYIRYNSSGITEETIEKEMDEVAYGLFSVVATLGSVPVIRCPRGGAPEMVGRKLNRLISEHPLLSRGKGQSTRPLLVILDRNTDLLTPIQHTSTYQALVDDVLQHNANRVEFKQKMGKAEATRSVAKKYDLDADQDRFYKEHKFNPFPEAIEQNGIELQKVTAREQEIKLRTSSDTRSSLPIANKLDSNTFELTKAIDSLPELLEHKKQLEIHTSILQAVMGEVAKREIPLFYELESDIATGQYNNDIPGAKKAVMDLIRDPAKGNIDDKIRLLAVFSLATTASTSDIDEICNAILTAIWSSKQQVDINSEKKRVQHSLRAISYLKKLRSINYATSFLQETAQTTDESPSSGSADILTNFMNRAQSQATGLIAKATERVSTMLGKVHKHYVTRVVENLCSYKDEDDTYLYLDPKISKGRGEIDVCQLKKEMMVRAPTNDIIAFMIGGGCYAEYQNLQMIQDTDPHRNICYGCTELVNSNAFMKQLSDLG